MSKSIHQAIRSALAAGKSVLLKGDPGTGKSSFALAFADPDTTAVIASETLAPEDGGVAVPDGHGGASLAILEGTTLFPIIHRLKQGQLKTIIVDDIDKMSLPAQRLAMRLFQDRRIAGITLPPDIGIIATCNRGGQGGERIIGPLLNRSLVIDWELTMQEWKGYQGNRGSGIAASVGAWLAQDESRLCSNADQVRDATARQESFPSPRAISNLCDALADPGTPMPAEDGEAADTRRLLMTGFLGKKAGEEISQLDRLLPGLTDYTDIQKDPNKAAIPSSAEARMVMASALGSRLPKETQAETTKTLHYLSRIGKEMVALAFSDGVIVDDAAKSKGVKGAGMLRLIAVPGMPNALPNGHAALETIRTVLAGCR